MRVKEIMSSDPACCTTGTKLADVAKMMLEHDCGAIPVLDNMEHHGPIGVITDRDIVCRSIAQDKNPAGLTAGHCMSSRAVTVGPDMDVEECERVMSEHQIRRILVTDKNGCLCGIVAQADIARHCRDADTARLVKDVSA
jgi:CBS-domain-containing membrane protein